MTCHDMDNLLTAYFDGELDLVHTLDCERHLDQCESCTQKLSAFRSLRSAIQSGGLYQNAPAALEQRIRADLPRPKMPKRFFWYLALPRLQGAAAMASFLLVAFVVLRHGGGTGETGSSASKNRGSQLLVQNEVIESHVRSLLESHLNDVVSTDKHTVKPWFNGKLDFSPPVVNLKERGFPLTGGRLDYLDSHLVAALVYHRAKHPINLYVWPLTSSAGQTGTSTVFAHNGYNVVHWDRGGMDFWAVSDLNLSELKEFASDIRDAVPPK